MMPRGWKIGAPVLVWPLGDYPPLLGQIVGQAEYGNDLAAGVQTEHGFIWATSPILSSARPIIDAIHAGKCISYGHC